MTEAAGWFHLSVKTMGRSAGRSVVAAAAYRLGERLHEREVDQVHDYRRRAGVAVTFTCAPADAPDWAHDPERLWNAANAAETRKNATLAREIELALPAAVDAEAREGIARAMAQELVNRYGVAVSGAIHEPSRSGDQRNHHAHILFTTRRMESGGLGAKTRVLDARATGPQEVTHLRGFACDLINAALAEAGSDERVDHRSFAAREIGQEPTTHLGPVGTAIERRSERSDRGRSNYEIVGANQRFHKLVEQLATLDGEIAAEQERLLDARFGLADADPPPPEPPKEPPSPAALPVAVRSPSPEREPSGSAMGLVERAKRAVAALFGRWTDAPVGSGSEEVQPKDIAPGEVNPPGTGTATPAVTDPVGDEVPADLITLGSQWTGPDPSWPSSSSAPVLSGAGEGALAAFFRGPPILVVPQPDVSADTPPVADLSAAWSAILDDAGAADPPPASPVDQVAPAALVPEAVDDFSHVHNEAIYQARADQAVVDAEEAGGGRFDRLRGWWTNMREHFVEWRDHLQERFHERVEGIRSRWDSPEPAPAPQPPGPGQSQPEPPMEPEP